MVVTWKESPSRDEILASLNCSRIECHHWSELQHCCVLKDDASVPSRPLGCDYLAILVDKEECTS